MNQYDAESLANMCINKAHIRGVLGDRFDVRDDKGPGTFSVKTLKTITTDDGDKFNKFDWHYVTCVDAELVKKLRSTKTFDTVVEVWGTISTTSGSSPGILASAIKCNDIDWNLDKNKRRRRRGK